jgi:hypothetical protein
MAKQFTKGDIVRLNSGSPDLNVTSCDGENVEVEYLKTLPAFPLTSLGTGNHWGLHPVTSCPKGWVAPRRTHPLRK